MNFIVLTDFVKIGLFFCGTLVGAWIETVIVFRSKIAICCRTLVGARISI